jgi:hypothetical protein
MCGKIVATFKEAIERIEKKIIIKGIESLVFTSVGYVNARQGKLAKTKFGKAVGNIIHTNIPFAIDYYGHFKKSSCLLAQIEEDKTKIKNDAQLKAITCIVIHFASIKIEDVAVINPNLLQDFISIKKEILKKRGFL